MGKYKVLGMRPGDFRKIEEYFNAQGYSASVARWAFAKYIENVESSVSDQKKSLKRDLSEQELRQICDNFLNPQIMKQYLQLSVISQDIDEKAIAKKYDKERGLYGFFKAVFIGVVSNFIFVIILILVYAAARDQTISVFEKLGIVETKPGHSSGVTKSSGP